MHLLLAMVSAAVMGDAQLCRFPAGGDGDPLRRWLTPGELTCAAPSELTFPPGRWNVFARTPTAISVEPVLAETKLPDDAHLDTVAAATLSVQLPAGTSAVVYVPRHASAVPAESRTIVPAGEELWLIVAQKGTPVSVIEVPPVAAGAERTIDAREPRPGRSVLAWADMTDADRRALRNHSVGAPTIRATAGERSVDVTPLPPAESLGGAFLLFPNAGNDALQLTLSGRGWLRAAASVGAAAGPLTVVRSPLHARLSATLTVNWSTGNDLRALDDSIGGCTAATSQPFELTIAACGEGQSDRGAAECRPIRTEPLSLQFNHGTISGGEVVPGTYQATLRYGRLPPVVAAIALGPLESQPLLLSAFYERTYGSLTRGGAPLDDDARIEFPGGGAGFAPRQKDYAAVVTSSFDVDAAIDVVTCRDERTTVLAEKPLRPKARYDIDIPDNLLKIAVVDTFTHAALPAASLHYTVMSLRVPRRPVLKREVRALQTNGAGADRLDMSDVPVFAIRNVPPERPIILEVSCRGYKTQKLDPFSLTKSETKSIAVELVPVNGSGARIVSARRFDHATLYWFSPEGNETEREEVADDGTFTYEGPHYRNESMVLVSRSHPLWIVHAPTAERRKELQIAFPDNAPVRNIRAVLPGVSQRMVTPVGLTIGGLHVPGVALAEHLALRELSPFMRGPGPVLIRAVAETAPIDVLRGRSFMATDVAVAGTEFTPVATRRLPPDSDLVALDGK